MEKKKTEYKFWIDKTAEELIEREEKLKRGIKVFRCESGLGASGFPHIGSFGDCTRTFVVALALKEIGVKSEYFPYADDRDGLRKVPLTLPDWLEKYIGAPVTDIPDPFECHKSYGEHMASLLLESLDNAGIEYVPHFASKDYKKGIFNEQIEKILLESKKAGQIIKKMLGQEKFSESLPYFPVCENCGKIYTTRSYEMLPKEHKILYVCDGEFTGKNLNNGKELLIKGCGHKGEASYFNGTGKMSWKVEFAMRWDALKILFEPHGKDILDSVKVNDEIDRQILNYEPPLHIIYELFLQKGGKKISKSYGNVFTPQVWMKYGSSKSLVLLMLKRFEGTRELDVADIPKYMDELDQLEKFNFNQKLLKTERDKINTKRLFHYVYFGKSPKKEGFHVLYNDFKNLVKIAAEKNKVKFVKKRLKEMKIENLDEKDIEKRITFVTNWINDQEIEGLQFEIEGKFRDCIEDLILIVEKEKNEEVLQKKIFEIARKHSLNPTDFFKTIYRILLNADRGPRLGPYIIERGKAEVIEKLQSALG
jgi:lysyl-tRNA synthetase class 1